MNLATKSSEYINDLINAGADAMQNLYYLEFAGKNIDPIKDNLKVRVSGFKPITASQGKHTVNYLTVSMDMPTAGFTLDKSASFSFRLDNNYRLYEYLLAQQSATMSGGSGWADTKVPGKDTDGGFSIKVKAFDRSLGKDIDDEEGYRHMYTLRNCWITGLSGLSYSYSGSAAMTITCNVKFLDYEDPMNLLNI